jgi:hypothetical protein
VSIETLPALIADPGDPRIRHALWCKKHVNEDADRSPEYGVCTTPFTLEFPRDGKPGDDVASATADLWFSAADLDTDFPAEVVYLSFNGNDHLAVGVDPSKLIPLAYMLMAAAAKARGDEQAAESFMVFARAGVAS